jgi:hypothetical protein
MARTRKTRIAYRDSDNGRFVSRATWRRSRSHSGEQYKRERVRIGQPHATSPRPKVTPTAPPRAGAAGGLGGATGAAAPAPIYPAEFLDLVEPDEYFDSGYESDEEDEY